MRVVKLTTKDNPWNPFTDWDAWDQFDRDKGYCTESYVATTAKLNDSIPDEMKEKIEEQAMDEIIEINKGIIDYVKVYDTVETYA